MNKEDFYLLLKWKTLSLNKAKLFESMDYETVKHLKKDAKYRRQNNKPIVKVISGNDNCPKCLQWKNMILIDNVFCSYIYSHKYKNYKLLSEAIKDGLFHKNCHCTIVTYYEELEDAKSKKESIESYSNYNILNALYNDYKDFYEKHHLLEEKIGIAYSIARYSDIDSAEFKNCIELCYEDISLAEKIKEYQDEAIKVLKNETFSKKYSSFKKLAILLEKSKQYDEAIKICELAIKYGFIDDETDGKMYGRIARLKSKVKK